MYVCISSLLRCVELLEHLLDLGVFDLDALERLLDALQAYVGIFLVRRAVVVLHLSVMLDLLTAVLHLCQAERRG